jgi:hypothetical protein
MVVSHGQSHDLFPLSYWFCFFGLVVTVGNIEGLWCKHNSDDVAACV